MCANRKYDFDENTAIFPVFKKRFKRLVNSFGFNGIKIVADKTGFSTTTINYWYRGERVPRADNLKVLSEKLGKSSDWFLGLTAENNFSTDEITKLISEHTGLSTKAVQLLHHLNTADTVDQGRTISFLNRVLSVDPGIPDETLFSYFEMYVQSAKVERKSNDELLSADEKKSLTINVTDRETWNIDIPEFYRAYVWNRIKTVLDKYLQEEEESKNGKA